MIFPKTTREELLALLKRHPEIRGNHDLHDLDRGRAFIRNFMKPNRFWGGTLEGSEIPTKSYDVAEPLMYFLLAQVGGNDDSDYSRGQSLHIGNEGAAVSALLEGIEATPRSNTPDTYWFIDASYKREFAEGEYGFLDQPRVKEIAKEWGEWELRCYRERIAAHEEWLKDMKWLTKEKPLPE